MIFQKITPYLWYDHQAREAAEFYCTLFNNAKILSDSGMIVEFQLEGIKFMALNGGPKFHFNPSVSFFVLCENQQEVDKLWDGLIANGGEEQRCGWCKDRFGLSWQVVPRQFMELMKTGTPEQTKRVMDTMLRMDKMVIEDLQQAFNG